MLYAVNSLYAFSTFFPSERSFLQQNFKCALHIEYARFQNASLQNCYLLIKLSALQNKFLRVALHISYYRTVRATYCLCSWILLSTKLKSNAAWEED